MRRLRQHYATIASTAALVVALTGAGAYATGHLISGKQIKNNSIKAKKVKFPRPATLKAPGARAARAHTSVAADYVPVADLGSYTKLDSSSVLEVTWTGTAQAGFASCVFQLRVDGQPPTGSGAEVYVPNGGSTFSVTDQGLFSGVTTGPHEVQIFAKLANFSGADYPCTVGPTDAPVPQVATAVELVN